MTSDFADLILLDGGIEKFRSLLPEPNKMLMRHNIFYSEGPGCRAVGLWGCGAHSVEVHSSMPMHGNRRPTGEKVGRGRSSAAATQH